MPRLASAPIPPKKGNLYNNFVISGALLLCSVLFRMVTLGGITSGPVWVISLSFCSFWFGFSRFCVASCFGLVFSLRSNKDLLLVSKKKKKNFMNTQQTL
jgi:hypothetical protein